MFPFAHQFHHLFDGNVGGLVEILDNGVMQAGGGGPGQRQSTKPGNVRQISH